jgi:hypothetical protein
MKSGIMPHGYSIVCLRKRLEKELHEARASELSAATPEERKRIEEEIRDEINRRVAEYRATLPRHGLSILWDQPL